MTTDQSRRAARRAPSGGLWADILAARRAHDFTAGTASREQRRPDERGAWLDDLRHALAAVRCSVGDQDGPCPCDHGGDPREALVELLAIGAAWVSAMDDRGIE